MKLCVFCENFSTSCGWPHYSEYTPGSEWDMQCYKDHWIIDTKQITTEEYRQYILTAKKCKDYKQVALPKEIS